MQLEQQQQLMCGSNKQQQSYAFSVCWLLAGSNEGEGSLALRDKQDGYAGVIPKVKSLILLRDKRIKD